MCKFSSKSGGGGVPFQISFILGDLPRNDPLIMWRIAFMPFMYVVDICYNIVSHTIELFIHLNKINKYMSYVKR